jgi:hypothetical protein
MFLHFFHTERRGRVVNTPGRIREVPGSNINPEAGYPDLRFFVVFPSPSR